MNILVCVCGSIAAYKACSLVSLLSREHAVKVAMTASAEEFVGPLTFAALSKSSVVTDRDKCNDGIISHIYYPQEWADIIVVSPATASIIVKAAAGTANDMVSCCLLAATAPVLFVPAMNTVMYENPAIQDNIQILKERGMYFVEPGKGRLACGMEGAGKYPGTAKVIHAMERIKDGFKITGKE